jgi:hypothetical protein
MDAWDNLLFNARENRQSVNAPNMPSLSNSVKMCLVESLESALARANTERPVSAWLKKHPLVISRVVGGHPGKVVAEFPFGSDWPRIKKSPAPARASGFPR